jgi:hypothetical protein
MSSRSLWARTWVRPNSSSPSVGRNQARRYLPSRNGRSRQATWREERVKGRQGDCLFTHVTTHRFLFEEVGRCFLVVPPQTVRNRAPRCDSSAVVFTTAPSIRATGLSPVTFEDKPVRGTPSHPRIQHRRDALYRPDQPVASPPPAESFCSQKLFCASESRRTKVQYPTSA